VSPDDLARARRYLARRDPVLGTAIKRIGACGLATPPDGNLFEGLVRAIAGQQLSVKAARTIFLRVKALAGGDGGCSPAGLLAVSPEALRGAGLSNGKVAYVRDLAERVASGSLSLDALHRLGDDEVIERLTEVKGIGRWTAEMILIFLLRRPDVMPLDDLGIVRAVQKVYGLRKRPGPRKLLQISEPWRPWRSVACWYLWASLDMPM
jgi:DNA-3-methyladenine glycosylase II